MDIKGSIALVTGANRGIGEAYVNALLDRGAAKVYAGVLDPKSMAAGDKVEVVKLDITEAADVQSAAAKCADVTLLVNNAGVNFNTPLLGQANLDNAHAEIDINYFGTLDMCRAFAPVLNSNGGGTIVNMLSILGLVNLPALGSYCASKAACVSLTQGVRAELAGQGTLVVGVMPGAVDTRITAGQDIPKEKPEDVAAAALDAVEAGTEDVYPGDMAQGVIQGLANEPKAVEKEFAAFLPS
jgi:NAD(P)-dependent dehydrogenase (short-subunit alcohol dehydrogenase family)